MATNSEQTDRFLKNNNARVLLSVEQIREKVEEIGRRLSDDYRGLCPIIIGVLNGSFMFCADLFRNITIDCEIDFIKISSYGEAVETSGVVKLKKDIDAHLQDRHVIVVEDIVDSGYSVNYLRTRLSTVKPKSLKFVSLLIKEGTARTEYYVDYVGFKIPNQFVIGYGLDYAQRFRNLPAIYLMDNELL